MRTLILAAGIVLLVTGCASAQDMTPDTSGKNPSPYPIKEFVARILGSTEDVWEDLFKEMGSSPYPQPTVVIFSGKTSSACGAVSGGPLYCPADRKVYFDTSSLSELSRRLGAPPSDFALAYLIVREVSRHVQTVLGTTTTVGEKMRQTDARGRNALAERLELQADCYTGIWAHFVHKRGVLEPKDLNEGVPFTRANGKASVLGTAEQRTWWFKQGLAKGDLRQCDTFVIAKP